MYQEGRGNIENEAFNKLDPESFYSTVHTESKSISLILGGPVSSSVVGEHGFSVDTASMRDTLYTLVGVGFRREAYADTLGSCEAVWIPIRDENGVVHEVRFNVVDRTTYRGEWTYLWNTGSTTYISGSWILDSDGSNFSLATEPYDNGSGSVGYSELDYKCMVDGADQPVIFVDYVPKNFEFGSDYNALLNNASSESNKRYFKVTSSVDVKGNTEIIKVKNFISDDHKSPFLGGLHAGVLEVTGGLYHRRIDQRIDYLHAFSQSAVDGTMQTLDLAFMNFRAISASVYVDREKYGETVPIEQVWEDLQEGNTDSSEIVFFIPRSKLIMDWESVPYPNRWWVFGDVQQESRTTTPISGNILFKMDGNNPVRHVRSTVYAPFINTVYRTDEYGVITELCSGSVNEE